jgi:hypothetical protein
MAPFKSRMTNEQVAFIVERLSMFDSVSDVQKAVRERFGLQLTLQNVEHYDPTKAAGKEVARRWAEFFWEKRKRFLDGTDAVGLAHLPARLRAQTRCFEQALRMGNVGEASAIIERVAKDANNYWTHRLDVRHAGHRRGAVEMSPNARERVYLPHNFREPMPTYDDDEEEDDGR